MQADQQHQATTQQEYNRQKAVMFQQLQARQDQLQSQMDTDS